MPPKLTLHCHEVSCCNDGTGTFHARAENLIPGCQGVVTAQTASRFVPFPGDAGQAVRPKPASPPRLDRYRQEPVSLQIEEMPPSWPPRKQAAAPLRRGGDRPYQHCPPPDHRCGSPAGAAARQPGRRPPPAAAAERPRRGRPAVPHGGRRPPRRRRRARPGYRPDLRRLGPVPYPHGGVIGPRQRSGRPGPPPAGPIHVGPTVRGPRTLQFRDPVLHPRVAPRAVRESGKAAMGRPHQGSAGRLG